MRQKSFSLLLAGVITASSLFVTSCSNDDEQAIAPVQPETTKDLMQQFNDASDQLNQELSTLNLDELATLTRALNDDGKCDCGCDECTGDGKENEECGHKKFTKSLKELLNQITAHFGNSEFHLPTYAFEDVMKMLKLTWTFTDVDSYGFEEGKFFNLDAKKGTFTCSYTTDNGTYNVKVSNIVKKGSADIDTARKLVIEKDGTVILSIEAINNINEQRVLPLLPAKTIEHTGVITIKNIIITLAYDRKDAHARNISLTIQKDGETDPLAVMTSTLTDNMSFINMIKHDVIFATDYDVSVMNGNISIKGHINNVNIFLGQAPLLMGIFKYGTSEDICNKVVNKFNENSKIDIMIAGNNMGSVELMPVFQEESKKYSVALVINSPLFGEEPVELTTMLSNLGFSLEDILNMITSGALG